MASNIKLPPCTSERQALDRVQMLLQNGFPEEAITIARQWPAVIPALPEELRRRVHPPIKYPPNPAVAQAAKLQQIANQIVHQSEIQMDLWLSNFITMDKDMLELKLKVAKLAPLDDSVLIQGETGTGKEIIANALHGIRNVDTFVPVNCAGMPEYLIESELFGHLKGAFTGADSTKVGLLKAANEGTIFLDEVGDLPLPVQAKLLRAIQEKKIRPVGSNRHEPITCRVVSASHHDLRTLVTQGKFRKDLYARLSTFELYTKPLRERLSDIPLIIKALDPDSKFPVATIKDWGKVDLSENYRSMQRIVKRYLVLGEMPKLILNQDETIAEALKQGYRI